MLKDLTVYLLTWNVAGQPITEDLHVALGLTQPPTASGLSSLPDIYAIGLQEVSVKPQNMLYDLLFNDPWIAAVKTILGKWNYVKVKQVRLQGLILLVYCKREHLIHLQRCQTTYTRTGFGGVWGNKGAVTFRMNIFGSSLCVVNCHLAAHDEQLQQRILEYNCIMDKQQFVDPQTSNIISHDYVFWIGDLNFRLNDLAPEEIMHLLQSQNFSSLLAHDQLEKVKSEGKAFSEFSEGPLTFRPTYKFFLYSNEFNYLSRRPAWTDRILHRFTPNAYENITLKLEQLHYTSHDQFQLSDHKPVTSSFKFKAFSNPQEKHVHFHPVSNWETQSDCTVWYRFENANDLPNVSDWIGLYKTNFDSVEEHLHYVWASTKPESEQPTQPPSQSPKPSSSVQPKNELGSQDNGSWYKVTFGDQCLLMPGWYRLLYVSGRFDDVLAMSDPFQVIVKGSAPFRRRLVDFLFNHLFYRVGQMLQWLYKPIQN